MAQRVGAFGSWALEAVRFLDSPQSGRMPLLRQAPLPFRRLPSRGSALLLPALKGQRIPARGGNPGKPEGPIERVLKERRIASTTASGGRLATKRHEKAQNRGMRSACRPPTAYCRLPTPPKAAAPVIRVVPSCLGETIQRALTKAPKAQRVGAFGSWALEAGRFLDSPQSGRMPLLRLSQAPLPFRRLPSRGSALLLPALKGQRIPARGGNPGKPEGPIERVLKERRIASTTASGGRLATKRHEEPQNRGMRSACRLPTASCRPPTPPKAAAPVIGLVPSCLGETIQRALTKAPKALEAGRFLDSPQSGRMPLLRQAPLPFRRLPSRGSALPGPTPATPATPAPRHSSTPTPLHPGTAPPLRELRDLRVKPAARNETPTPDKGPAKRQDAASTSEPGPASLSPPAEPGLGAPAACPEGATHTSPGWQPRETGRPHRARSEGTPHRIDHSLGWEVGHKEARKGAKPGNAKRLPPADCLLPTANSAEGGGGGGDSLGAFVPW
jgi:hypothetical protein